MSLHISSSAARVTFQRRPSRVRFSLPGSQVEKNRMASAAAITPMFLSEASAGDQVHLLLATEKQALRWLIACDFDEESPVRVLSRSTSGVVLMANGYTSRVPAWVARVTLIHRIGVVTRHP